MEECDADPAPTARAGSGAAGVHPAQAAGLPPHPVACLRGTPGLHTNLRTVLSFNALLCLIPLSRLLHRIREHIGSGLATSQKGVITACAPGNVTSSLPL